MEELWKDTNIFYNILCFFITENEKLFDRSDSNLYWRTVFHIFGLLHHVYVGIFAANLDIESSNIPDVQILFKFRAAYLTGWNFAFQTIFLGLSLGHDVLEWLDKHEGSMAQKIQYYRDIIFSGMVVPCTLFVTSMFWIVYAIDRELVFPRIYDQVVPWWFNHCVHTNITIVVLVETLLQSRRQPVNSKLEHTLLAIVAVAYAVVYYSIYFIADRWLYQVFGVMNWWQICLYQLAIWATMYIFYVIQYPVNRIFHGPDDEENVNEQKSKDEVDAQSNEHDDTKVDESHTKVIENGTKVNGVQENEKVITDLKTPPFSTKSWSLKFRNIRSQFENSRL